MARALGVAAWLMLWLLPEPLTSTLAFLPTITAKSAILSGPQPYGQDKHIEGADYQ